MGMHTEKQMPEMLHIFMKNLLHIIIKHYISWFGMHHRYSTVIIYIYRIRNFTLDKFKIRNWRTVIKIQCIRIQCQKFNSTIDKRKIKIPIHRLIDLSPCPQMVMISNNSHIRNLQLIHNIMYPTKFFFHSKITDITPMYHKINVISPVHCLDKILCLIVPALSIPHKNKTDSIYMTVFLPKKYHKLRQK